jgi:hypothetical protein
MSTERIIEEEENKNRYNKRILYVVYRLFKTNTRVTFSWKAVILYNFENALKISNPQEGKLRRQASVSCYMFKMVHVFLRNTDWQAYEMSTRYFGLKYAYNWKTFAK